MGNSFSSFAYGGPGTGLIDVFDLNGNLLHRLIPNNQYMNLPRGAAAGLQHEEHVAVECADESKYGCSRFGAACIPTVMKRSPIHETRNYFCAGVR